MNPDSLPSFDEWRKEARRLQYENDMAWGVLMIAQPGEEEAYRAKRFEAKDALLAHLRAHPSAAPQAVLLLPEQPQSDKGNLVVAVGSDLPPALPEDTDAALIERFVSGNEQFHISTAHPVWLYCKDGDGNSTSLRGDWFAASLRQFINPGPTK